MKTIWATVGQSAGVRILVLPVSAILGIFNTRLIIEHFGQATYAQYTLLVGIGALIPFADLGITAAIMNAVAASDSPSTDPHVRRVLITSFRILAGSVTVVLLIAGGITAAHLWPTLLGEGLLPGSGSAAAALCLASIGLGLTVGFGQRVLAGLGKNHVSIALLGLQTPVVLLSLVLMIQFHLDGGAYLAVISYLAIFVISAAATVDAARRIRPAISVAFKDTWRVRTIRGDRVFDTAWPMLVQMVALPMAMQTDRLLLSHVSNLQQLSEYSLASQMYTPIWAVVSSAGIALWPIFAKARAGRSSSAPSPMPIAFGFAGLAAVACLIISLASPWLADKASDGQIHLGLPLILCFSIFMIIQAFKYPLGMYMTDAAGLRYQAWVILFLLLPLNLGVSWVLALHLGAVGPVIGSGISVFVCQVLANWLYVRKDIRRRLSDAGGATASVGAQPLAAGPAV